MRPTYVTTYVTELQLATQDQTAGGRRAWNPGLSDPRGHTYNPCITVLPREHALVIHPHITQSLWDIDLDRTLDLLPFH